MSDVPREPLEPELIPRPADAPFPGSPVFRTDDERVFPIPPPPMRRKRPWVLIWFLMTCATTFYAGCEQFGVQQVVTDPATGNRIRQFWSNPRTRRREPIIDWSQTALNGLTYAGGVILILGCHEMGHYLQARRYRVPARGPFFIPMPVGPFGTMGAVILQDPGTADRKSLFDIAISGPLAGLVVALPLNWWAIQQSRIGAILPNTEGWTNPLIVEWMIALIHRPLQPGEDIALTPLVFAGWVGIFITGLNLIPIGQLDGGHILYCLMGRRAHRIAHVLYLFAIATVLINVWRGRSEYVSWTLMLLLIGLMGTRHPPTANDRAPLGKFRIVLGWLTLMFIVIGFVPTPQYINRETPPKKPAIERNPEQEKFVKAGNTVSVSPLALARHE